MKPISIILGAVLFAAAMVTFEYFVRLYTDPEKLDWDQYDALAVIIGLLIALIAVVLMLMANNKNVEEISSTTWPMSTASYIQSPVPLLPDPPQLFSSEINSTIPASKPVLQQSSVSQSSVF
jgi:hypothetical protein